MVACAEMARILEVLWLPSLTPPKPCGDKHRVDDGDSLSVHFDGSPLLIQAICKKYLAQNVQFSLLPTAFSLGDMYGGITTFPLIQR